MSSGIALRSIVMKTAISRRGQVIGYVPILVNEDFFSWMAGAGFWWVMVHQVTTRRVDLYYGPFVSQEAAETLIEEFINPLPAAPETA